MGWLPSDSNPLASWPIQLHDIQRHGLSSVRRGGRQRLGLHRRSRGIRLEWRAAVSVEPGDATLAAQGDTVAFERLYRAQVARIHSLARRMAGDDMADDLTQEVFVRAWEKLGTFRGEASFGTWLHRLAVNLILSQREKRRKRESREFSNDEALAGMAARRVAPAWAVDMEAALLELPDRARTVFVLYDVEGYTHEEIGGMMGITSGTSKSQLHRARMLLRERLA